MLFFVIQCVEQAEGQPNFNGCSQHASQAEAEAAALELAKTANGVLYVAQGLQRVATNPKLEKLG